MCCLILLHVSSYCYICVVILLYMCPHTTIYVSSYHYICVVILLYVSSYYYVCPHTICVLILLYMWGGAVLMYLNVSYFWFYVNLLILLISRGFFFLLAFFFSFRSTLRTSKGFPLFSVMWGLAFNREKCIHQLVYLCLQRIPVRASVDE